MRDRIPWIGIFLFFSSLLSTPAQGWETRVRGDFTRSDWRSIYEAMPGLQNGKVLLHGNEHAEISAMALHEIGAGKLLGTDDLPVVVDLNASWFRRDLLYDKQTISAGNRLGETLELRLLPPPAMFSGIPDFSYSIYDWINKNKLCPLPEDAPDRKLCHAFNGWLGAALNASHFGTQAKLNYQKLHKVALRLADHARLIRKKLAQTPGVLDAYHDHVREAEWMALAYEGFAQHFLADRWSTGHMWERWNAGDFEHLPVKRLQPNALVGYLSGMIHGWQAALHARLAAGRGGAHALWADPLSVPYPHTEYKESLLFRAYKFWIRGDSPQIHLQSIDPAVYRHREGPGYQGVGDDVLKDMWDGDFGGIGYGFTNEVPLVLPNQRMEMMACIEGGWADVIRALGKNREGSYGILKIPLNNDAPSLQALGGRCFDMYVTNRSMMWAWPFSRPTYWSQMGRAVLISVLRKDVQLLLAALANGNPLTGTAAVLLKQQMARQLAQGKRAAKLMVQISHRIWERARRHPGSTDLARGGLGALDFRSEEERKRLERREVLLERGAIIEPGDRYPAASYLPPEDLSVLPDRDDRTGRDKETVFGFFSKAMAPLWKDRITDLLTELRALDYREFTRKEDELCQYLADLVYNGTDPSYHGKQAERRTVDGSKGGREVPSFLTALGISMDAERLPIYLPPGYVSKPYRRAAITYQSVTNWCHRVPVLFLSEKPEERDQDIVAVVEDTKAAFELKGKDLGDEPGKVHLGHYFQLEVLSWSPSRIRVRLPQDELDSIKPGDYSLAIIRKDGAGSPGRFIVRIGKSLAISGTVREKDGGPIADAIVSVQLAGKRYTATSNARGAYAIGIPSGTELPDSLFVLAEKAGYVTATRSVKKEALKGIDFVLDKKSKNTVQIDSGLHHLGNSQYGGAINSQFQMPQAEGASYRKNFHLSEQQAPPHIVSAELLLTVRGAEENNPVAINGLKIGFLSASNPDGSASVTKLSVDACSLAPGDNTLTITASDSNSNSDIDDFEFTNVQLVLKEAESLELDDPTLAKLSKVKAMAADFSRSIRSVNTRSRFSVEAAGKGRCARAPDVAMVQVYLRREGEDQARNLKLVETGPDTGVFRSREPLDVADFQARGGDVLVLRAGLRGTALKIVEAALKVVWRVYSLEVKRYQRLLPDISLIETRLLRGDGRAVLERVRYPVSLAKGPAVDAMLWGVNWQAGHRLERKQAEGETAIRRLMVEAESLRETGSPLDALPERMAAAYGKPTRPLKKKWGPPGRR